MYELYYWPGLPGRGEFVRLVLECAGQPYRDVGAEEGVEPVAALKNSSHGFAPPFLKDGDVIIAQAPAICLYLARKHGLLSDSETENARIHQLLLSVMDVVSEVHDTHHPVSMSLVYEEQKEAALQRAAEFLGGRLSAWMEFFSAVLDDNEYLVASNISVADLALFQLLCGLEYAFPNAFKQQIPEKLKNYRNNVASIENIADYLKSDCRQPFNENGIFRHYPELDVS